MEKKDREFWPIHMNCPDCHRSLSLAEVAFSADGKVAIVGECSQCSKYTAVVDTWEHIMEYCNSQDGFFVFSGNDLVN